MSDQNPEEVHLGMTSVTTFRIQNCICNLMGRWYKSVVLVVPIKIQCIGFWALMQEITFLTFTIAIVGKYVERIWAPNNVEIFSFTYQFPLSEYLLNFSARQLRNHGNHRGYMRSE